ncbi:hypothetical protein QL285_049522 [Trifolium repens]|nr:hypothetical protein QL285_049522 [Trifolium repens]
MASLLIFQQSSVDVIVTRNFSTLDIKALYQISVDGKHYAIKITYQLMFFIIATLLKFDIRLLIFPEVQISL